MKLTSASRNFSAAFLKEEEEEDGSRTPHHADPSPVPGYFFGRDWSFRYVYTETKRMWQKHSLSSYFFPLLFQEEIKQMMRFISFYNLVDARYD